MTFAPLARPSNQPSASDLPPELSALIDDAMARKAMAAVAPRPVMPIVRRADPDAPLRVPHLTMPKKRTRVAALEDMVLVGLLVGLLLAAWVSLLVGLNIAQTVDRMASVCIAQAQAAQGRPSLTPGSCNRPTRQG